MRLASISEQLGVMSLTQSSSCIILNRFSESMSTSLSPKASFAVFIMVSDASRSLVRIHALCALSIRTHKEWINANQCGYS